MEQLNAQLATMKLQKLELKNTKGYLSVTRDGDGNLLSKRYGLDSGKLVCALADGWEGYCYQIDTFPTKLRGAQSTSMEVPPWTRPVGDSVHGVIGSSSVATTTNLLIVKVDRFF